MTVIQNLIDIYICIYIYIYMCVCVCVCIKFKFGLERASGKSLSGRVKKRRPLNLLETVMISVT